MHFRKKWTVLWKMIYVCWSCLILIDNALNLRIKQSFYAFALSPLFDIIYNPFQSLIKALSWQCTACLYLPFVFSHGLEVKLLWDFGGTHAPVNVLRFQKALITIRDAIETKINITLWIRFGLYTCLLANTSIFARLNSSWPIILWSSSFVMDSRSRSVESTTSITN